MWNATAAANAWLADIFLYVVDLGTKPAVIQRLFRLCKFTVQTPMTGNFRTQDTSGV